jgi:Cysteine rich repeat
MTPIKIIAAISVLGFTAMSAFAADAPPRSASPIGAACKQDVQTLCKDIQPGEGRVKECLMAHRDQWSPGCKAAIKENHREKSEQAAAAASGSAPPASAPPAK